MEKIEVAVTPWSKSGALLQLPDDYGRTNKRYPLIIFLHGKSKSGTDLAKLTLDGIPYWLNRGARLDAVNPVDKRLYKFIVVAPQAPNWGLAPSSINLVLNDIIARYRIDSSRIYITGYSAGGWATIMAITDNATLSKRFAAAVPMSPSAIDNANTRHFKMVADANIHCWYFAGSEEVHFRENAERYIDSTDKYKSGLTRITDTNAGHHTWKPFYDPHYRDSVTNMSIYQWMLQYKRSN